MAKFEVVMPKMGESITEATITKWMVKVGDTLDEDDSVVEIATDKVDSEIPSPVEGVVKKIFYNEGDVVAVGKIIAEIETEGAGNNEEASGNELDNNQTVETNEVPEEQAENTKEVFKDNKKSDRFYSPLVKKIAKEEKISSDELEKIQGSGKDGRVNKQDILNYLEIKVAELSRSNKSTALNENAGGQDVQMIKTMGAKDEIIEMDRVRKLIADHMVMSKKVSPHVNSFIEIDVTRIVNWRNKVKQDFFDREGAKITFTHIFIEAIAKALRDFPRINASLDGNNIIVKKDVNIGMATALPNGNLIVPVIKNADQKNLVGIVKSVNDLAERARNNQLKPDEIQGGTFSITNLGSFGTDFGTPIINQPQLAILAVGAIKKKPVVVETPEGDLIAIRSMMYASLAYDHRVIDGALGGMFLKRFAEYLEGFDGQQGL